MEHRVELRRRQEALQAQGAVLGGAQLVELFGLDADVLVGAVLVAAADGGGLDGSVRGALFGVAEALTASGVEQVCGGQVAAADGGEGLERDADQAELEQARPTGPAVGGCGSAAQRQGFGGVGAVWGGG